MLVKAFTERSLWFKSKYELSEVDGLMFISPVTNNQIEDYDPFDQNSSISSPKTSEEHFLSSPHVALARINVDDIEEILTFVNTWGLLGLWKIPKFLRGDFLHNEFKFNINEIFEHPFKRGRAAKREPLHFFIQAANEYQNYLSSLAKFNKDIEELPLSKDKHRQILDDLSTEEEVNESKVIQKIAYKHKVSKQVIQDVISISATSILLPMQTNEYLRGNTSPQIHLSEIRGEKKTGWYFNSLISSIYLKSSFDKPFQHCTWKKCNQLFISANPQNKHCSENCGNSHRQEKAKIKKWKQELTTIFRSYNPSWVENQIDLLLEKGISGRKRLEKELISLIEREEI